MGIRCDIAKRCAHIRTENFESGLAQLSANEK